MFGEVFRGRTRAYYDSREASAVYGTRRERRVVPPLTDRIAVEGWWFREQCVGSTIVGVAEVAWYRDRAGC